METPTKNPQFKVGMGMWLFVCGCILLVIALVGGFTPWVGFRIVLGIAAVGVIVLGMRQRARPNSPRV
jgi:hypothetical protein